MPGTTIRNRTGRLADEDEVEEILTVCHGLGCSGDVVWRFADNHGPHYCHECVGKAPRSAYRFFRHVDSGEALDEYGQA